MEFLGCEFECPRVDMSDSSRDWKNVKVEVDFDKVILQDNEEDGMLTGEVKFILYKGNHYHLTVFSDWDENVFVDTNDVWDDGDRVEEIATFFLFTQELGFAVSHFFGHIRNYSAVADCSICIY